MFLKALAWFLGEWMGCECLHRRVGTTSASTFCPDCGYKVKTVWQLVTCRGCQARRVPHVMWGGKLKPVDAFCRHCGETGFRVIRKSHIEAYELLYAVSAHVIDYSEDAVEPKTSRQTRVSIEPGAIVDGQVLQKRVYQSPGKSPFRKAATSATSFDNVVPLHQQSRQSRLC